jgi:DNA-binding response OmpR family regulator
VTHIILLEDERLLREDLTEFLVKQGHAVQAVGSIAEFESGFVPGRHLIAILDLGLPDGDGMDVIGRLRRDNLRLGIIVLTARMAIRDKVAGLQSGADHYLTKTTDMDILAATVDALARRLDLGGVSGDWVLDGDQKQLVAPGLPPIELSAQDYTVLKAIFDGQGQSVSKKTIVAALGEDFLSYDLRRLTPRSTVCGARWWMPPAPTCRSRPCATRATSSAERWHRAKPVHRDFFSYAVCKRLQMIPRRPSAP